jgi:hypothetical protein
LLRQIRISSSTLYDVAHQNLSETSAMKKTMDAMRRGLKAARAAMKSRKYSVADKPVRCPHCAGEEFDEATALLNTTA